jgi:hypothetical protein
MVMVLKCFFKYIKKIFLTLTYYNDLKMPKNINLKKKIKFFSKFF